MNNNDYIIHYGVKGMKWGVRKDKRKQLADKYRSHKSKLNTYNKSINTEGQKLINRSKGMRKDFGDSYKNSVDDEEYFELVARTEHNLNTSNYWKQIRARDTYLGDIRKNKDLYKSLKLGKKYAKKGF